MLMGCRYPSGLRGRGLGSAMTTGQLCWYIRHFLGNVGWFSSETWLSLGSCRMCSIDLEKVVRTQLQYRANISAAPKIVLLIRNRLRIIGFLFMWSLIIGNTKCCVGLLPADGFQSRPSAGSRSGELCWWLSPARTHSHREWTIMPFILWILQQDFLLISLAMSTGLRSSAIWLNSPRWDLRQNWQVVVQSIGKRKAIQKEDHWAGLIGENYIAFRVFST